MRGRRRGREASAAERALFLEAVGEAGPVESDDSGRPDGAPAPRRAAPSLEPDFAPLPPALAPGAATGVDARAVLRLRRGQTRPEARLDLHGHTLEQAHRALARFIERAAGDGRRCVLVITGKGSVGQPGGTIRGEFPRWLNQGRLRPHILAFAEAQPKDGGAGAFYVLLRKRRGQHP
ncbi:MAG: Smr/MutS family protein [Defluviicoccus sp.]|nr:Smr/MutS family protein [Defluviicoccus sp.]